MQDSKPAGKQAFCSFNNSLSMSFSIKPTAEKLEKSVDISLTVSDPQCCICDTTEATAWERVDELIICGRCFRSRLRNSFASIMLDDAASSSGKSSISKKSLSGRKGEIYWPQKGSMVSMNSRSGCSKRTAEFKRRAPIKSPEMPATFRSVQSVYHQDHFFKLGDIVRLYDQDETEDEALPYFAQINGLLVDQFAEKYAALTWLLPTKSAPGDGSFHPDHFISGKV